MSKIAIIESGLSLVYQDTDIALEVRTPDELNAIIEALRDPERTLVALQDRRQHITVSIYLRFRE